MSLAVEWCNYLGFQPDRCLHFRGFGSNGLVTWRRDQLRTGQWNHWAKCAKLRNYF